MKNLKGKIQSIKISWALICLMMACVSAPSWAVTTPEHPTIYSAALDDPSFPKDTVDAQLSALSAEAWVMIDAESGLVLSSKNPDKRMYPASLTKMMTCILACESGRLTEVVTISAAAAATECGNVKKGEKYVLRDLLYRAMLPSDNGAAHAIGEFLAAPDSVPFADLMNKKARELGMNNTHFVNAHGLPNENHYTTAHDMMTLQQYCMNNKDFAEIVSNPSRDITTTSGKVIHLKSTNRLFGRYDGCIGVKTGTTRAAGGCLASAVVRDGVKIYLVLLKCTPARQRTDESIVLYDKGFEMMKTIAAKKKKRENRANVPRPKTKMRNQGQKVPEVPASRKK
ncbi:MAG: D-alanyl-D-alanine carboxypeptidase [Muribaculaceae bacterium]|nr:D-alanyl-D-alanine carboxypeptidase [Muribaculaceae bacterium]